MQWPELSERLSTLEKNERRELSYDGFRPAAVAVIVTRQPDNSVTIPLTVRSESLRTHSGQISFPGGRIDDGESAPDAAVRETEEELGIDRSLLSPIGMLDDIPTPTAFMITPVITVLTEPVSYDINPREVAKVFDMPLSTIFDMTARDDFGTRHYRGLAYPLHAYHYEGYRVWGATARILRLLGDHLLNH